MRHHTEEEEEQLSEEPDDWMPVPLASVLETVAATHTSLSDLVLNRAPLDEDSLASVLILVVRKRLAALSLMHCGLGEESIQPLAQLLTAKDCALRKLFLVGEPTPLPMLVGPHLPTLCAALSSCRLTELGLLQIGTFTPGFALLRALIGHPTLATLDISYSPGWIFEPGTADPMPTKTVRARRKELAGLLVELVTSETSPLTTLGCAACCLYDDGATPLFEALARPDARLRALNAGMNVLGQRCFQRRILPALRANASLRELEVEEEGEFPELKQAKELVAARGRPAAAAAAE